MYGVTAMWPCPVLVQGPALIVCAHTSIGGSNGVIGHRRTSYSVLNGERDLFPDSYPVGICGLSMYSGSTRQTAYHGYSHDVRRSGSGGGRYGKSLQFQQEVRPSKESLQSCTKEIMKQIEALRKSLLPDVS